MTDTRARRTDRLTEAIGATRAHSNGLYLGHGALGGAFAPAERGLLVLGPPRSGKSSAVVIPNVLGAAGACFVVSTKSDVLAATHAARRRRGRCVLFDPTGVPDVPRGVERVGWSPLSVSRRWDDAVLMADAMVGAAHPTRESSDSSHWLERASALLSCILHAGAIGGLELRQVCAYLHRREIEPFTRVLAMRGAELALDVLTGLAETESRELSGIWSTASGVLAAYRTDAALRSAELPDLDTEAFLSGAHTLYVVAPGEHQRHAAPLIAGLLREVRTTAFRRARRGGAETRTLLLVLDELAQIAPIHDLPALVAEGGSQGILTLACLQDLSQARMRWGVAAEGFLSLFGAKLVLGGIGDVRTLQALSLLAGDHERTERSSTTQRAARGFRRTRSVTRSPRRVSRLEPSAIADPKPGTALCVIGAATSLVRLTPYFSTSPWREASAPP